MGFIRPPLRLIARQLLRKIDVEDLARTIVFGVGGTAFSGGSATTGPQASRLDNRNLSLRCGIPNFNKAVFNSVYNLQVHHNAPTGTVSLRVSLPFDGDGISPAWKATAFKWTLTFGNSATTAGSAKLFYTPPNGAEVQIDSSGGAGIAWTAGGAGAAAYGVLVNDTIANVAVDPQGQFRLEITITAGTAKDFVGQIWVKSKHVR